MILEVYAGKKQIVRLMPHYKVTDGELAELPTKDCYAIPGGSVKAEAHIRKWASEFGYVIKKYYQEFDCDENNLLP